MYWQKHENGLYLHRYEWTSYTKHGDRYKQLRSKPLTVAKLSVKRCDAETDDLFDLILLGAHLNVPVRYDFKSEQQEAYIEIVSAEKLKEILNDQI